MKKAALLILVFLCFKAAQAQENHGGMEVGLGIDGGLPVGNLNIKTKFGVGGDATVGYNFTPRYALFLRGGYIGFIAKKKLSDYSITTVGDGFAKVCGRYTFLNRFYVEPQVGISTFRGGKGAQRAVRGNGFTYAGAAGLFLDKTKAFDVSIRYESTTNNESISFVGLRLAYSLKPGTYW